MRHHGESPASVLVQHLHRDHLRPRGDPVEVRVEGRTGEAVAEDGAGDVGAVRVHVLLPLVRLLGHRGRQRPTAAERLGQIRPDPIVGEVGGPGREEPGVQDRHVDPLPGVGREHAAAPEVGHVDRVLIPGVDPAGEVGDFHRRDGRRRDLAVLPRGGDERELPDGGQVALRGAHVDAVDLGELVEDGADAVELSAFGVGGGTLEDQVDPDGAAGARRETGSAGLGGRTRLIAAAGQHRADRQCKECESLHRNPFRLVSRCHRDEARARVAE